MLYVIFDAEDNLYGAYTNVSTMLVHLGHYLREAENMDFGVAVADFDQFGAAVSFNPVDDLTQKDIDDIVAKSRAAKKGA